MKNVLSLINVFKNLGGKEVLKNISIDIRRGESVAIVGKSGSGKTTLLQIAGLLMGLESGSVNICGITPKNQGDMTSIRKEKIGFVYQFHRLLPEFSVIENVMIPLIVLKRKKIKPTAENLLDSLEIGDLCNKFPHEISGGQRQRVAIARAIVHKPDLIIADEPTGNLDVENTQLILKLLNELKQNSSILVATHDKTVAENMDRIFNI